MRLDMRIPIRLKGRDALLERRLHVLDVHRRHDIVPLIHYCVVVCCQFLMDTLMVLLLNVNVEWRT